MFKTNKTTIKKLSNELDAESYDSLERYENALQDYKEKISPSISNIAISFDKDKTTNGLLCRIKKGNLTAFVAYVKK